jgi:hypothetical protein
MGLVIFAATSSIIDLRSLRGASAPLEAVAVAVFIDSLNELSADRFQTATTDAAPFCGAVMSINCCVTAQITSDFGQTLPDADVNSA